MHTQIVEGLTALGFDSGWVLSGEEIVLWDNTEAQPSLDQILEAAKNYVKPQPTVAQKLASVGLSVDDLKVALGL
jgi:hypothetical protein